MAKSKNMLTDFEKQLTALKPGILSAFKPIVVRTVTGIKKGGEVVLRESNAIVPVDTGELRDSGKLVNIPATGKTRSIGLESIGVEIAYTAGHAFTVHEDLSQPHDDGQAKFLEQAFNLTVTEIVKELGGEVR